MLLVRDVQEPVRIGDGDRAGQERYMDDGLPHQHLGVVVGGVDEGLEQVDRADADDGQPQLHLEHRGVDVAQPFGLVGMGVQVEPAHEGFVPAHYDHDEQVRDHHHVDERQHHQHDHGLVERDDFHARLVADARDQRLQRRLVAEGGLHEVPELHQEVPYVHALGDDEPQVQGQL